MYDTLPHRHHSYVGYVSIYATDRSDSQGLQPRTALIEMNSSSLQQKSNVSLMSEKVQHQFRSKCCRKRRQLLLGLLRYELLVATSTVQYSRIHCWSSQSL